MYHSHYCCRLTLILYSATPPPTVGGQNPSQLPSFTLHPQSVVIASGGTTNLTCSATSSSPPITYVWLRDNSPIDGANVPWNLVGASDAGEYSCLATNAVGTVISSVASVQQASEPIYCITMCKSKQTKNTCVFQQYIGIL